MHYLKVLWVASVCFDLTSISSHRKMADIIKTFILFTSISPIIIVLYFCPAQYKYSCFISMQRARRNPAAYACHYLAIWLDLGEKTAHLGAGGGAA